MQSGRVISLLGLCTLCAFLFAACGTSNSVTSNSSSVTTTTSTQTAYPSPTPDNDPTPTTSASTSASTEIKTATATVNGKTTTILTTAKGLTLYYFTPDTSTTSACMGGCASAWPPLLVTGSSSPTSATTLPGKLTVLADDNGKQVQYNGHFLYTYAGDSAPGQTNGEGSGGKWYVATTDLS
jgi:predicted lipoprotein with Yx(FWY)xxD motif